MKGQTGFSLIEVMVAALMILLGVTGYVSLQSEFVKADDQLNKRNLALLLAQKKLDDLASFTQLESGNGMQSYTEIKTNLGGALPEGQIDVALNNDPSNVQAFELSWDVVDLYHIDTDSDGINDLWVTASHTSIPQPLPLFAQQKDISVNVEWLDHSGQVQVASLSRKISPVIQSESAYANHEISTIVPTVRYVASQIPDTYSFALSSDNFVENASPLTLSNQEVLLSFDTYVTQNNGSNLNKRQEFVTVACQCELGSVAQGYSAARETISNDQLTTEKGQLSTKLVGLALSNGQSPLCTQCCRDHHDTNQSLLDENAYRIENGLPHEHFKYDSVNGYLVATQVGDEYDEICRLKRIDGLFEVFSDWHLIALLVLPPSYLSDANNQSNYASYITSLLSAHLQGTAMPLLPANRDFMSQLGDFQFTARAIYVDTLTSSEQLTLQNKISNGDSDWLSFVPFYEINVTLMAHWQSSNTQNATVSNENISVMQGSASQYYNSFSRGKVTVLNAGSSVIQARVNVFNSGVLGIQAVSSFTQGQFMIDDSVSIK